MEDWTSREDVLSAPAKHGLDCASTQFDRWVREGLLPHGRQVHRPGRRGSESFYPPGADQQLVALCRLRTRERRLERLRLLLWWREYEVDEQALRESLKNLIEIQLAELKSQLDRNRGSIFDTAEQIGSWAADNSNRDPVFSLMRSMLGNRDDLRSVVHSLVALAYGEDPEMLVDSGAGPEQDDDSELPLGQLVMRAIGAERATSDQRGRSKPLFDDQLSGEDVFSTLRSWGLLPVTNLPRLIDTATSEELARARDDARMMLEDAAAVAMGLQKVFGRKAPPWSAMFRVSGQRRSVPSAALLIAAFVGFRRVWSPAESRNFDAISATMRATAPIAKAHLTALGKALPGLEPKQRKSPARPLSRPAGMAPGGTPDAGEHATARRRTDQGTPPTASTG